MPAGLDRTGIEWHRAGIERLLVHLSDTAEAWATDGGHRAGESAVRREPSRVAQWAAALPGPSGVPLAEELERVGLPSAVAGAAQAREPRTRRG